MGRFWNLRTKLVGVLVLVLTGTFLLQTAIHEHNEQQLLLELEKLAQDIVKETGDLIAAQTGAPVAPLALTVIRQGDMMGRRTTLSSRARPPGLHQPGSGGRVIIVFPTAFFEQLASRIERTADRIEATAEWEGAEEFQRELLRIVRNPLLLALGAAPPAPVGADFDVSPEHAGHLVPSGGDSLGTEADFPTSVPVFVASRAPLDEGVSPTLDVTPHIDRVQELFNTSKRHDFIATVGVFLIGIALAWFLGVRVTRPVDEVVQGFRSLAEGDFEARVPERPGAEFGHLGRQFNAMVARVSEGRELERELSQRERIQHMGDLAAGVAHDVRNPLNAIHLNIGQIRDEFVPEDERARERFLRFTSDVQHEVERLNRLVTNFLSLAQPAAREAEPVDPNELVDELSRLLQKDATGRRVELTLDLAEELPQFTWNRQEMKSAFLNIAINALQALGTGGGRLAVATARREGRQGSELVVHFADDGPGIPPEDLERVFVPYYTTRKGGTGLGMAIARRTAERHGGRIELRSTVGEGTSVTFVFPYPEGEASS